jgi:hypothetical protein
MFVWMLKIDEADDQFDPPIRCRVYFVAMQGRIATMVPLSRDIRSQVEPMVRNVTIFLLHVPSPLHTQRLAISWERQITGWVNGGGESTC